MLDSTIKQPVPSECAEGSDADGSSDAEKAAAVVAKAIVVNNIDTAAGDAPAADDDDDYDKLLSDQERKEDAVIDDMMADEEDKIINEGHELGEVVQGNFTDEKLKQMRSLYVEDGDGNSFHKKSLLAQMNQGISLSKSTDRTKRVRGESKFGGRKKDKGVTLVMKAFSHDRGCGPNSGDDRHSSGDFCCVMVEPNNKLQHPHMVIGKLLRFGDSSCRSPLDLQWPLDKEKFNASILVCEVTTYLDVANELCLRAEGNSILTLQSVQSNCFVPIVANLEETAEEDGTFTTNALMKISDLTTLFDQLSKGNRHKLKPTISLPPIKVNDKFPFVVTPTSIDPAHVALYFLHIIHINIHRCVVISTKFLLVQEVSSCCFCFLKFAGLTCLFFRVAGVARCC